MVLATYKMPVIIATISAALLLGINSSYTSASSSYSISSLQNTTLSADSSNEDLNTNAASFLQYKDNTLSISIIYPPDWVREEFSQNGTNVESSFAGTKNISIGLDTIKFHSPSNESGVNIASKQISSDLRPLIENKTIDTRGLVKIIAENLIMGLQNKSNDFRILESESFTLPLTNNSASRFIFSYDSENRTSLASSSLNEASQIGTEPQYGQKDLGALIVTLSNNTVYVIGAYTNTSELKEQGLLLQDSTFDYSDLFPQEIKVMLDSLNFTSTE